MTIKYCSWETGDDTTGNGTSTLPYKTINKASTGLSGGDEVRVAKSPVDIALTGTLTFTAGSAAVTGIGTGFTTELTLGDFLVDTNGDLWEVDTINSNTSIVLFKMYGSDTQSNIAAVKAGVTNTGSAATSSTQVQSVLSSGLSVTSRLLISGGWNLDTEIVDGTTRLVQTNVTLANRYGYGLYLSKTYVELRNMAFLRYNYGIYCNSHYTHIEACRGISCGSAGLYYNAGHCNTANACNFSSNGFSGVTYNTASCRNSLSNALLCSNGAYGLYYANGSCRNRSTSCSFLFTMQYGLYVASSSTGNMVFASMFKGNSSGSIKNSETTRTILYNCALLDSIEVAFISTADITGSIVYSGKHDQTENNDRIFYPGGIAEKQSVVTESGSGFAWKITTTSSDTKEGCPIELSMAKMACAANSAVTITAYVKKDHATNIGARLLLRGMQIAGQTTDVIATKANDTDWQPLTLTFTPTEAGVIEIVLLVWYAAGHSSVYIDTLAVSQA